MTVRLFGNLILALASIFMILFLRLLFSYEVSIEEVYQAIEEVFDHRAKPLEVD